MSETNENNLRAFPLEIGGGGGGGAPVSTEKSMGTGLTAE